MKKAIVLYWSAGGNTEKVAASIREGLAEGGMDCSLRKLAEAGDVDFFAYDLVCFGVPSYSWHPPKPADDYLKAKFSTYRSEGHIKVGAPVMQGRSALIFCTYSGPHTGIREALPAGKYMGQFFEHLGFIVVDEWYVVGEFHGSEENNTMGRMGDIRGLPDEDDLKRIRGRAKALASHLTGPR